MRDLPEGHLSADTLFIMTTAGRAEAVRVLILSWKPDGWEPYRGARGVALEVADMMGLSRLPKGVVVFRVWWD